MMLRPLVALTFRRTVPTLVKGYNKVFSNRPVLLTNERISHTYKFIYIHVPKTAGTSITNAIDSLPSKDAVASERQVKFRYAKHIPAERMRAAVGKQMWDDYFTFAFVRNPWDLIVSSYNWWLQSANNFAVRQYQAEMVAKMENFDEYVRFISKPGNPIWRNSLLDMIGDNGEIIVDYVARFETLHKDWEHICAQIGAPYEPLPHLNPTKRRHYSSYYTDETRKLVAQKYARSIELLGYAFEEA